MVELISSTRPVANRQFGTILKDKKVIPSYCILYRSQDSPITVSCCNHVCAFYVTALSSDFGSGGSLCISLYAM